MNSVTKISTLLLVNLAMSDFLMGVYLIGIATMERKLNGLLLLSTYTDFFRRQMNFSNRLNLNSCLLSHNLVHSFSIFYLVSTFFDLVSSFSISDFVLLIFSSTFSISLNFFDRGHVRAIGMGCYLVSDNFFHNLSSF